MGCDIHLYNEKLVNGKWVPADRWAPSNDAWDNGRAVCLSETYADRNYNLFGLLAAGVRTEHPFSFQPRGLPDNVSPEVRGEAEAWGHDGHNHSHLYLNEMEEMRAHLEAENVHISGMKDREGLKALRASIASGAPNWDLLFPYCMATNCAGYESFEVDVPASFPMGDALDTIISGLESVGGDSQRIVFWFDS